MNYAIHRISLDVTDDSPSQLTIAAKQGDTAKILIISLLDDKKNYQIAQGSTAVFIAKKANGVWLEHPCTIDYKSNKVLYTFKEDTVRTSGTLECEIHLSFPTFVIKEDGTTDVVHEDLTTASFVIAVHDTILSGLTGTTEEVSLLPELITKGSSLFAKLEEETIPNVETATQNAENLTKEIKQKIETGEFGTINLKNGEGNHSVQQKYIVNLIDYGAKANGIGSAAFGGVRYDKLDKYDPVNNPGTTVNGNQSFGSGANVIIDGDFSMGGGKDNHTYQRGQFVSGGGNIVGDVDGKASDYGFLGVGGETNKVKGRGHFTWASNANIVGGTYCSTFGELHKLTDCNHVNVNGSGNLIQDGNNLQVNGVNHDIQRSNASYFGGVKNTIRDVYCSFIYAYESTISGNYVYVTGVRHTINGSHNFCTGSGNNDNGFSSVRMIGEGLQATHSEQTLIGSYNEGKEDTIFELGYGGGISEDAPTIRRANAVEVYGDARMAVYGKPVNGNDVVRKNELDNANIEFEERVKALEASFEERVKALELKAAKPSLYLHSIEVVLGSNYSNSLHFDEQIHFYVYRPHAEDLAFQGRYRIWELDNPNSYHGVFGIYMFDKYAKDENGNIRSFGYVNYPCRIWKSTTTEGIKVYATYTANGTTTSIDITTAVVLDRVMSL